MSTTTTMRDLLELSLLRAGLEPRRTRTWRALAIGACGALAGAAAALLLAPAAARRMRARLEHRSPAVAEPEWGHPARVPGAEE